MLNPDTLTPQLRHQRIDGAGRVAFGPNGISDLYQRAPCRFLFPAQLNGSFHEAVSITTSGGLTGGDKVALDVRVEDGCMGTVTTQAAEKLYRVLPGDDDISIKTSLGVGVGAHCEWLGQEAIAFDQTRMRRTMDARLAKEAKLLAVESLVLGRGAMGERYESGRIHDAWRIWREGQLIWADALRLEGDIKTLSEDPFHLAGVHAISTVLYAGADAADHLQLARTLTQQCGGATLMPGLLILRFAHKDAFFLRQKVASSLGALRSAVYGLSETLPTVWNC